MSPSDTQSPEDTEEASEQTDTSAEEDQEAPVEDPGLPLDVVFEIAKNERRRLVLKYLDDEDGPVDLGDLAEHIAALENDKPVRALSSAERKRVYVGLYQCHLPKMDGADVVNFDRSAGITLGENADEVLGYLDVDTDPDWQWTRYYLALSGVGLVAVTLTALFAWLPATPVLAGFVLAVVGLSVARSLTDPS